MKIFFSWQNHFQPKINRYLVRDIISRSIKEVNLKTAENYNDHQSRIIKYDEATRDKKGAPDIASTIFQKIDHCKYFVADVSFAYENKLLNTPNSNVLIELGYAASKISWSNIMLVFNEASGSIEKLPFDIRGRRVLTFRLSENSLDQEFKNVERKMTTALKLSMNELVANVNILENDPIVKIHSYLWNRILSLYQKWNWLIIDIEKTNQSNSVPNLSSTKKLQVIMKAINSRDQSTLEFDYLKYNGWADCISSIARETMHQIRDIFIFQDKIDLEIIDRLVNVDVEIYNHDIDKIGFSKWSFSNLEYLAHSILTIRDLLNEARDLFMELYNDHLEEHHRQYKKHNILHGRMRSS